MRAAIYCRVSTSKQTTDNQNLELTKIAKQMGWDVVAVYSDTASGATHSRPQLDQMMESVMRKDVDVVMAWSVDRLGRSLQHLVTLLNDLESKKVHLYLHQQKLDTTTPAGKALFQMIGVFSEFERSIITDRINSGIARAKEQGTKSGKPIGRPAVPPMTVRKIQDLREEGMSYSRISKRTGVSTSKISRIISPP